RSLEVPHDVRQRTSTFYRAGLLTPQRRRQMVHLDLFTLRLQHRSNHNVLQLTDVPWPGMAPQQIGRSGREPPRRSPILLCISADEVVSQSDHVSLTLPQGWDGDGKYVET